ncbi:MAG: adenosylcobinamide-GDP ribazoletransferase [Rikenellaceae bacterium]
MNLLFNAFLCYSRLPAPRGVRCTPESMSQSIMFFPLVGLIVGGVGLGVYMLATTLLPHNIAIIISMVAMMLTTGAFHEDGFADFCDGFGGGYDKASILRIMKDSHIGTYGVLGLIMVLIARYTLLCEIPMQRLLWVLIVAQGASRVAPVVMVRTSQYARSEPSKSSYSKCGVTMVGVVVAMLFGLLPLALLGWQFALIYIGVMSLVFLLFRGYIYRHIEGYTGDTLGALQVIGELMFYALFVGCQHFVMLYV